MIVWPGHTHEIIDQRFACISIRLRVKDAFTPSDMAHVLYGVFHESEDWTEYVFIPGIQGADEQERLGTDMGPGDFKAAFEPHVRRFDGMGTEASGRR